MSSVSVKYDATWVKGVRAVTRAYVCATVLASALGTLLHASGEHPVVVALLADVFATAIVFGFSLELNNSSTYDPYWHLAPPVLFGYWVWARASANPLDPSELARACAMGGLLACWSLRLTWNWLKGWGGLEHEDWRYASLRVQLRRRGAPEPLYWLSLSLVGFHLVPTLVVFSASVPIAVALAGGGGAPPAFGGALDALALAVGMGGVVMQAVADEQLRAFRAARAAGVEAREDAAEAEANGPVPGRLAAKGLPANDEVAACGLWAYSRHPNYLGELLHWLAYVLFALGAGAGREHALALAGWLPLLLLFVYVSVPLMETQQAAAKPAYADYQRRVSMLLPLPLIFGRRLPPAP
jgi:steroid 5-alpha reductase family enzyme